MDFAIASQAFGVFVELAVIVLETAAALVILVAAGWALMQYLRTAFPKLRSAEPVRLAGSPIRMGFGRSLLLALEFTVGATILKVSITPTLQEVSVVAVVVAVRVVLALVLQYELSKVEADGAALKKGMT